MINRDTLYHSLERASVRAAPSPMTAEEIQVRSQRLNDDIEHLECMVEVFDDKKMSQEVLISECLVAIDLLNLYTSRVPLTGPEPIRFFRKEYMTRLRILSDTLNTLIRRVRTVNYYPGSAVRDRRRRHREVHGH